jgi:uncharacterized protein YneF (UPF0154 family)
LPLSDSVRIQDTEVQVVNIPLADVTSIKTVKGLSDAPPINETYVKVFGKVNTENVSVTELLQLVTTKVLSDNPPISESIGKVINPNVTDSLSLAETVTEAKSSSRVLDGSALNTNSLG